MLLTLDVLEDDEAVAEELEDVLDESVIVEKKL